MKEQTSLKKSRERFFVVMAILVLVIAVFVALRYFGNL